MVKKGDVKAVAIVTAGVFLAGFAMYMLRDNDLVDQARSGFGA